jgi:UDP-glucose 4-epimerase
MTNMVIGGSGFIGSETLKMLAKSGIDTISYDIIQSNNVGESNKWIRGDILELASIERIFFEYQVDTILHLVGLPAIDSCEKNPRFSFLLNVMSVQNTLEAMRMADVKRIIFASSATVYGSQQKTPIKETGPVLPNTIYGYHKLMAEETIKSYSQAYGIEHVILRLFNVYGANPHLGKEVISIFIRKALKGESLTVKGPNKFRDFVHVSDVAQAFLKADLNKRLSNTTLNIGSGTKTSLGQVARIVKRHFPKIEIKEEPAPDDGTGLRADISLAKKTLRFVPTDPKRGISEHVARYAGSKRN